MPELPEIEHLRRTLSPALIGATVTYVDLRRRDIVRRPRGVSVNGKPQHAFASASRRSQLLRGDVIDGIERRGKELAILGSSGRVIGIHLGMSGQVLLLGRGERPPDPSHVHCVWRLRKGRASFRMLFRDPRRFGGLWSIESVEQLCDSHWATLGPDALLITRRELSNRLSRTRRAIKVALLDQRMVAGVGNIYADEALHAAGIHPLTASCDLDDSDVGILHRSVRRILRQAIDAGGSTIRDYRDGTGEAGRYADRHRVYGRAGLPCRACGIELENRTIAQRTSTFCPACQSPARCCPQVMHNHQHHR